MLQTRNLKHKAQDTHRLQVKTSTSPRLLTWKIAYQTTKQAKLLNMFQNMLINDQSPRMEVKKGDRSFRTQEFNRSSYQIYKEKQRCEKEKLQEVHSIQKPKLKLDEFYCTLRVRESRSQKRKSKEISSTLELGTLNSVRSEMHERKQMKKQIVKIPRQCVTQSSTRKFSFPRKYSLDQATSPKKFTIRKTSMKDFAFTFNGPCRPWSPADFHDPSTFITDQI